MATYQGAYDPKTGVWKTQDSSVENKMVGLLSKNNAYMQQGETQGLQAGNRRGLLNSSMGVQAGQAARVQAALPIASQDAAQAHQTNVQSSDLVGAKDRLNTQLASQEKMTGQELESREKLQQQDIEFRTGQGALDREAQERIATMDLASRDKQHAGSVAQAFESSYAQIVSNIMNNPDIPAAERQRYLDHAAKVRDSNYALVEQIYGIDLQWGTNPNTLGGITPNTTEPAISVPNRFVGSIATGMGSY